MAETIDLLEPFRDMEGMEIEGSLEVTLDKGAIAEHVGEALASRVREGLSKGQLPDGRSLPGVKDDTERRRGPGTRGHRTGEFAESYAVRRDGDVAVVSSEFPERGRSVFGNAEVFTDEVLKQPDVDAAFSEALRQSLGDE